MNGDREIEHAIGMEEISIHDNTGKFIGEGKEHVSTFMGEITYNFLCDLWTELEMAVGVCGEDYDTLDLDVDAFLDVALQFIEDRGYLLMDENHLVLRHQEHEKN
jgi:hypothetical protein